MRVEARGTLSSMPSTTIAQESLFTRIAWNITDWIQCQLRHLRLLSSERLRSSNMTHPLVSAFHRAKQLGWKVKVAPTDFTELTELEVFVDDVMASIISNCFRWLMSSYRPLPPFDIAVLISSGSGSLSTQQIFTHTFS